MPGLIELHTDHLEQHLTPRPKVKWPTLSALMSFDAQIAASGITTVYDCMRAGNDYDYTPDANELVKVAAAIVDAQRQGLLRAEHNLHVRCEIWLGRRHRGSYRRSRPGRRAAHVPDGSPPGARQFANLEAWRIYYGGRSGRSEAELDDLIQRKHDQFARNYERNRTTLVQIAHERGVVLASHDDAKPEHC